MTEESRPSSPKPRQANVWQAVLAQTRRRPRPRKRSSTRLRARRALKLKTSPSRPRRPRPSLPVVALCSIKPGPPFSVHSSVRDERKRRRELLLRKASQAGRHKELPIIIDGAEVRAGHSTHRLLHGSCRIGVRPSDRIDHARQHTSGVRKCGHPFVDPVLFVWLERALGRAQQEKVHGELNSLNIVLHISQNEF